jgi:4-hydroxy-3-methylbut-2-enyl diphosphate reductase
VVKGGLLVDVGIRGFVPASQISRYFVKNMNDYLNKPLRMKIIELNRSGRKVVLSQKVVLEEENKVLREAFWNSVHEGDIRKGIVKRITDFGAFVDVGGMDGLLHVSEMGWSKVNKPSDVVSVNDEIDVYILRLDREKEKVSLGLRQLLPNPWDTVRGKFSPGRTVKGKVMRIAPFGAFIELEPGIEGLAHISQLANYRVSKVEDVLTPGQFVDVKIIDIDLDRKRISLSVKDAEADKEAEAVQQALNDQPEAEPATMADAAGADVWENAAADAAGAPQEETDGGSEDEPGDDGTGLDEDEAEE